MVVDSIQRKDVNQRLRHIFPGPSATAQAIDSHEPWDQIAMKAVADGYINLVEEFNVFLEVVFWPAQEDV